MSQYESNRGKPAKKSKPSQMSQMSRSQSNWVKTSHSESNESKESKLSKMSQTKSQFSLTESKWVIWVKTSQKVLKIVKMEFWNICEKIVKLKGDLRCLVWM